MLILCLSNTQPASFLVAMNFWSIQSIVDTEMNSNEHPINPYTFSKYIYPQCRTQLEKGQSTLRACSMFGVKRGRGATMGHCHCHAQYISFSVSVFPAPAQCQTPFAAVMACNVRVRVLEQRHCLLPTTQANATITTDNRRALVKGMQGL